MLFLTLWSFWHWSPLVYAGQWTQKECTNAKWLKTWDFSCADFNMKYADYLPKNAGAVNFEAVTPANDTSVPEAPKVEPVHDVFQAKLEQEAKPKASAAPVKEEKKEDTNLPLRIIEDDEIEQPEPLLAKPEDKEGVTTAQKEEDTVKVDEQKDEAVPIPDPVGAGQTAKADDDEPEVKRDAPAESSEGLSSEEEEAGIVREPVEADPVQ